MLNPFMVGVTRLELAAPRPQSSALPTAPHPDKSYAFLLPEYINIMRGILQALNYIFYFKSDYLFSSA